MKKFLLICSLAILALCAKANNVVINSVAVVGANVQFSISWESSWNTTSEPNNWDAVWVFVKRQSCTDFLWTHSLLSTNPADHSVTGGVLQVDVVADGVGVFIRRSAVGYGNIATATVTLALQTAANAIDNFHVYGIEMASIPQGDFYIGDGTGGTSNYGFRKLLITSAMQTAGIGAAGVYQPSNYGSTGNLSSAYPIGWNNFYCMKYEISQEQYVAFLNSLTFIQQANRTAVPPSSVAGTLALSPAATPSRNRIEIMAPGVANNTPAVYGCDLNDNDTYNENGDGQNIACNYLSWPDLMAYLDWSGLRPMTEFEYEKVCRGTADPLAYEYPWSSTALVKAESGALANAGLSTEISMASGNGLCAYGIGTNSKGPLRCGFAATGFTNREQSGSSFYGVMEMAGNVMEQCVGGYASNYSAFTTANGGGRLTTSLGNSNVAGWPITGGGQVGGVGRGGDWYNNSIYYLMISDRAWMIYNNNQARHASFGGRGVRNF